MLFFFAPIKKNTFNRFNSHLIYLLKANFDK